MDIMKTYMILSLFISLCLTLSVCLSPKFNYDFLTKKPNNFYAERLVLILHPHVHRMCVRLRRLNEHDEPIRLHLCGTVHGYKFLSVICASVTQS